MKSSGLIFNVSRVKDDVIHEMDCWPIPETRQEHRSRTYFQIRLCRACWPNRAFITETGIGKKTNIHRVLGMHRSLDLYCLAPHLSIIIPIFQMSPECQGISLTLSRSTSWETMESESEPSFYSESLDSFPCSPWPKDMLSAARVQLWGKLFCPPRPSSGHTTEEDPEKTGPLSVEVASSITCCCFLLQAHWEITEWTSGVVQTHRGISSAPQVLHLNMRLNLFVYWTCTGCQGANTMSHNARAKVEEPS